MQMRGKKKRRRLNPLVEEKRDRKKGRNGD